jgi:hypothetical protein
VSAHVLLFVFAVSLAGFTNWQLRDLSPWHLAPQLTLSQRVFDEIVNAWRMGQKLERYRLLLYFDFLTLTSYGLGGYLWVNDTNFFDPLGAESRGVVALLLPLAALADVAENLLHLRLTSDYPTRPAAPLYFASGMASRTKFILLGLFGVMIGLAKLA